MFSCFRRAALVASRGGLPAALGAAAAARASRCDQSSEPNPLWPRGVSPRTIEAFVDATLEDPSINIKAIPDWLERIIYRSTVKLVLDLVYRGVSKVHGIELIGGHRLLVDRAEGRDDDDASALLGRGSDINTAAIDAMVDRLMANHAVNSSLVPDFLEREIYANCLKLVFRIVDALAATLKLHVCGNELRFEFVAATSSCSKNTTQQQQLAASKVDPALVNSLVESALEDDKSLLSMLPFYRTFMCDVHKAIIAAALAVIDDVLHTTELRVIDERVALLLAPALVAAAAAAAPPPSEVVHEAAPSANDDQLRAAQRQARVATCAAVLSTLVAIAAWSAPPR